MKTIVDDIMEKMPEQFNMSEIMAKVEERTPYVIVCFQVRSVVFKIKTKTKIKSWIDQLEISIENLSRFSSLFFSLFFFFAALYD